MGKIYRKNHRGSHQASGFSENRELPESLKGFSRVFLDRIADEQWAQAYLRAQGVSTEEVEVEPPSRMGRPAEGKSGGAKVHRGIKEYPFHGQRTGFDEWLERQGGSYRTRSQKRYDAWSTIPTAETVEKGDLLILGIGMKIPDQFQFFRDKEEFVVRIAGVVRPGIVRAR
jgi:hypothetical protein